MPTACIPTACQPRARHPFRFLYIRPIERVDPQPFAQRHGRVLPPQEFGAEVERIGREHVWTNGLRVDHRATVWLLHDWNDAATFLAGALSDELLDPVGERGDPGRRTQAQLVPCGP